MTSRLTDPTARRVLQAFADCGAPTRLHTLGRYLTAPFVELGALLPDRGRLLDYGCGHGIFSLYLAAADPHREVHGVDIDERKLVLAERAAERLGVLDRIRFQAVGADWSPPVATYDAVACVDVAYLLGTRRSSEALDSFASAIRPGGVVVVKEMGDAPRWKRRVLEAQERLSTGPLGLTMGSHVEWVPIDVLASTLRTHGLDVERQEMDRHHLHPHVAVVARRSP